MITEKKILKKIETVEAAAVHFIDEATDLRQMLKGVSTPFSTRKGTVKVLAAKCISKRNKQLIKK